MQEGKLTGRVALISGAAQGIGLAISAAFVASGARVVGLDLQEDKLGAAYSALGADQTLAMGGDVTQPEIVQDAVEAAVAQFGKLDLLVCNAATTTPLCKVEELDVEDWRRALDVNLTSAFLLSKFALPEIRRSGGGNIIIVASQMGSVGWMGQSAYCSTKGALIQLGKVLALDYAKENIRVNTLSPGGVATDRLINRYGSEPTAQAEWGPMHPVGRLGQADEIARGAVFLASDDSTFMTGSDLVMDGGYTAW
tara:strand:+ start:423 stop:1181 length:759 start_codon:yes stop_codon:yes gene_type:complete